MADKAAPTLTAKPSSTARSAQLGAASRLFGASSPWSGVEGGEQEAALPDAAPLPVFHFGKIPIQAKLTVGPEGDAFEEEADATAERVMRMPDPSAAPGDEAGQEDEDEKELRREKWVELHPGDAGKVQRKHDEEEEGEELQRKAAGGAVAEKAAPAIVHQALRSPGQPLDAGTRAFMEPRFGQDFSRVRVHAGALAADAASAIRARAFTVGADIVFNRHAYAPSTSEGRRLLARELSHVRQQAAGRATAPVQRDAEPRTTLDPTYEDTPNAAAIPEGSLAGEIVVDTDGDQVPDLKLRISAAARDPKSYQPTRVRVELETVKRKPTDASSRGKFEFDAPPELDLGTIPAVERQASGFQQLILKMTARNVKSGALLRWSLLIQPEAGDEVCQVWAPKDGVSAEAPLGYFRVPLSQAALAVHSVFRPEEPRRGGESLWTLDVDVGAYSDPFRLTFQKPTPGEDTLEIGVAAIEDGAVVAAGGSFKTTLAGPLDVKIVSAEGASLALDLDGDGTADTFVYDRLDAKADLTKFMQIPDVTRFRHHLITVEHDVEQRASWDSYFDVQQGHWKAGYAGPGDSFATATAAAAVEPLAKASEVETFAGKLERAEQARMGARSKAASDKLIRPETMAALDKLTGEMTARRAGGVLLPDAEQKKALSTAHVERFPLPKRHRWSKRHYRHEHSPAQTPEERKKALGTAADEKAKTAIAAAARALLGELLKEPGLAGERKDTTLHDFTDKGSPTYTSENPYTGQSYYYGPLGGEHTLGTPQLEWLAKTAEAQDWSSVEWHFTQVEDAIDTWIGKKLSGAGNKKEAGQLEGMVKFSTTLRKVADKPGVVPVAAVFYEREAYETKKDLGGYALQLFYYKEGGDWKLTNLTQPSKPFTVPYKDSGEALPPKELFLKLNDKDQFPKGFIEYRIPGPPGGSGRSGRVETTADWKAADILAWTSAALGAAAFVVGTFGAGSLVVTSLVVLSGVAGAGAAAADVVDAYKTGSATPGRIALDAVQVIGSILGGGAAIAAEVRGAQAAVKAGQASGVVTTIAGWEGVGRMFVPLTVGAAVSDTVQFLSFASEVPEALANVDASGGTEADRVRAKVLLLGQLAGMGALTIVGVHNAGSEMRGAMKRMLIEVVDGVPFARLSAGLKPEEYEKAINAALSPEARAALGNVEVKAVSAAEMKAATGSATSRAAVVIEGGKPRVIALEGVQPRALEEDFVHLEQWANPETRKLMQQLEESKLKGYSQLKPGEKLELTKAKLTLEIDAQRRLLDRIDAQIEKGLADGTLVAGSPQAEALYVQAEDAWVNLEHLRARDTNLVGLERELASTKGIADQSAIEAVPRLMNKRAGAGYAVEPKWRRLNQRDFVDMYRRKYPDSTLSVEELKQRHRDGLRLNPKSGRLAGEDREQVVIAPGDKAKLGPETRLEPGSKDLPLTGGAKKKWDDLVANREKWRKKRASLEAKGMESEALRTARYELNEASRQIGEYSAVLYVNNSKGKYPDAKLIYGGGVGSSRSGDFDLVFQYMDGKKTKYLIVEAKGGSADLGFRKVGGTPVEQGNIRYRDDVIKNMAEGKVGAKGKAIGEKLQLAGPGDIDYVLVKAPFESAEGSTVKAVKAAQFQ